VVKTVPKLVFHISSSLDKRSKQFYEISLNTDIITYFKRQAMPQTYRQRHLPATELNKSWLDKGCGKDKLSYYSKTNVIKKARYLFSTKFFSL